MAYNHFCPSDTPAARPSGWQIVKAKLPRLYPVHFTTFLLQLFFVPAWSSQTIGFILSFGLLNLTLHHPRPFPRRRARQSRPPPVSVFCPARCHTPVY